MGKFFASNNETKERALYVQQKLEQLGWSKTAAIGLAAGFIHESEAKPHITDGGQAYGLGQWHQDRQNNFARVFGLDIRQSNLDQQILFVDWELKHTERAAGRALRTATTAEQAAEIATRLYERPRDIEGESMRRASTATEMASYNGLGASISLASYVDPEVARLEKQRIEQERREREQKRKIELARRGREANLQDHALNEIKDALPAFAHKGTKIDVVFRPGVYESGVTDQTDKGARIIVSALDKKWQIYSLTVSTAELNFNVLAGSKEGRNRLREAGFLKGIDEKKWKALGQYDQDDLRVRNREQFVQETLQNFKKMHPNALPKEPEKEPEIIMVKAVTDKKPSTTQTQAAKMAAVTQPVKFKDADTGKPIEPKIDLSMRIPATTVVPPVTPSVPKFDA